MDAPWSSYERCSARDEAYPSGPRNILLRPYALRQWLDHRVAKDVWICECDPNREEVVTTLPCAQALVSQRS